MSQTSNVVTASGASLPGMSSTSNPGGTAVGPGNATGVFITQRAGTLTNPYANNPGVKPENANATLAEGRRTLQSTILLQKKREMQKVQDELERKRAEHAKRMEECRERQEELAAKQRQLRERINKFEKFLKENDAKRHRANVKAAMERKLREQKDQEISNLSQQLADEEAKARTIRRMLTRYAVYEAYLQRVVEVLPQDYLDDVNEPQIKDILSRHRTLVETNAELMRVISKNGEEIEKEQVKLAAIVKEKDDLVLVFNSKLGETQKKLDRLKAHVTVLESRAQQADENAKSRSRTLGATKMAVDNLFERVGIRASAAAAAAAAAMATGTAASGQSGIPNSLTAQTSAQLTEKLATIQDRMMDLVHIASKAEQFQDKAVKSKQQQQALPPQPPQTQQQSNEREGLMSKAPSIMGVPQAVQLIQQNGGGRASTATSIASNRR